MNQTFLQLDLGRFKTKTLSSSRIFGLFITALKTRVDNTTINQLVKRFIEV